MSRPRGATPEGTRGFAERHPEAAPGHFRSGCGGWTLSSIGLGTYLGAPDDTVDSGYGAALSLALELGCNVVDTAIVYRHQRSERALGRHLASLLAEEVVSREELVIATKGGYLPHDAAFDGPPAAYIQETLVRPGIIRPEDVVAGSHCLAPRFLRSQLELSRRNLGCEAVDIYYLHNPESQLAEVDRRELLRRVRAAFEMLEQAAASGEVGVYGTATWTGYRVAPDAPDFLSLPELEGCAREVAGDGHRFRAVQLPFNLAMPEAHALLNQPQNGPDKIGDGPDKLPGGPDQPRGRGAGSLLEVAADLGITVMCSASLLQARLAGGLDERLRAALDGGLRSDAQRALQFARSAPGVTTALVGMSDPGHAVENCSLASLPPLPPERFGALFR